MKINSLSEENRKSQAAKLAPILRGMCSSENSMIGHFTDDDVVLEFINSNDLNRLAPMGTSCPDHFLRTKIKPLLLDLLSDENLEDVENVISKLTPSFEAYRKDYLSYYDNHKNSAHSFKDNQKRKNTLPEHAASD